MIKTVSGTCEDCGKPFKNKYKPSKDWEPSKSFYCEDCVAKLKIKYSRLYEQSGPETSLQIPLT
jgi:hypothetical protein